jgi:DNA-binding GntR family transcriptional regulator
MKAIAVQPNLVEQVKNALLEVITSGKLNPGERIIQ